mmetsp:Transcript_3094/g.19059  ORF Transcript_3094/g.19059 Transcript_3094/m.19059 type:complete len:211 (-) Transcript_3094:6-638(-)
MQKACRSTSASCTARADRRVSIRSGSPPSYSSTFDAPSTRPSLIIFCRYKQKSLTFRFRPDPSSPSRHRSKQFKRCMRTCSSVMAPLDTNVCTSSRLARLTSIATKAILVASPVPWSAQRASTKTSGLCSTSFSIRSYDQRSACVLPAAMAVASSPFRRGERGPRIASSSIASIRSTSSRPCTSQAATDLSSPLWIAISGGGGTRQRAMS